MREPKIYRTGYELCSVNILQAPISYIDHRGEIDPKIWLCDRKVYPVIVAPMGAVTNEYNYKVWLEHGFICVVPRTVDFEKRLTICRETFCSFSLKEAEQLKDIFTNISPDDRLYICIDIAHGTMNRLYEICKELKEIFHESMVIMTGNVANPNAYKKYCECGISYMRLNIGTGSRCTTACATGVYYPSATLLHNTFRRKKIISPWIRLRKTLCKILHIKTIIEETKIIYDGGIGWYDDIQKAIALGADAVMSGKLFAECEEACGEIGYAVSAEEYEKGNYFVESDFKEESEKTGLLKYRNYAGMSHRSMQKITGGDGGKVSEGIVKPLEVKHTISHWTTNMVSYLTSAMSYAGCLTIPEFREKAKLIINGTGSGTYRK